MSLFDDVNNRVETFQSETCSVTNDSIGPTDRLLLFFQANRIILMNYIIIITVAKNSKLLCLIATTKLLKMISTIFSATFKQKKFLAHFGSSRDRIMIKAA